MFNPPSWQNVTLGPPCPLACPIGWGYQVAILQGKEPIILERTPNNYTLSYKQALGNSGTFTRKSSVAEPDSWEAPIRHNWLG